MMKIAILTCKEIDENAFNDDNLIIPLLKEHEIEAEFKIWDDPEVEWSEFDSILVRSTWDYTEKIEQFVTFINSLPSQVTVFNSKDIILNNYNKSYLLQLEKDGFEIVTSLREIAIKKNIENAFAAFGCNTIIIKPLIGAGASGIQIIKKNDNYIDSKIKEEQLIQPFLESISVDGEISLIFFNGLFSHAIQKIPKKDDFRSQEEFGSKITSFTPDLETIEYSKNVLESMTKDSLFARVDLLKNSNKSWRLVGEVELIEPALYLSFDKASADRFTRAIVARLKSNR